MKKIFIIIILGLLLGNYKYLHAQNGEEIEAPLQNEYYPDGKIKKEYCEKRRKTVYKVYYPDGQLKYKRIIYKRNQKKITTVYYADGTRKSQLKRYPEKDGVRQAVWKYWGEDGELESLQFLENGAFISTEHFRDYTTITESGDYKIEILYKKGKWKGRGGNFTRIYDKEGNLINETPLDETLRIE